MTEFRKRLCTLFGCIILICTLVITVSAASAPNCPGNCGHKAAIGAIHYDTLSEAVSAAKEGSTVTLLADTYITASVRIRTPLTLDLGGNTLTAELASPRQTALRFLADGTVRNGKISVSMGSALRASDCILTIEKDAELYSTGDEPVLSITAFTEQTTLVEVAGTIRSTGEGVAIDASSAEGICQLNILEDAKLTPEKGAAITFDSEGKLQISGGTILTRADAIRMTLTYDRDTEIAITDGKILSREGQVITFDAEKFVKLPKNFVIGGTFRPVPADYIPANSQLTENTDGTVTVNKGMTSHQHSGGYATCVRKAICSTCGQSYGSYGSHSLIHKDAAAPTCDSVGMNAHSACQHCGNTYVNGESVTASSLSIAALGHDWENKELVPATCQDAGVKAHRICKTCQSIQIEGKDATEEDLEISAGVHQLETVAETQASCKEAGVKAHQQCSVCEVLFVNGKPVAIADITSATSSHVLSDWQQDNTYHWKVCVDCQEVFRQNIHKDKDMDAVCDECGYALNAENKHSSSSSDGFSVLYLLPVLVAAIIPVVIGIKKKSK